MRLVCIGSAAVAFTAAFPALAAPEQMPPVSVKVSASPTHAVSPRLYGLFLEDISLSVDGGLYPELVWNRSFDMPATNTPGMKAFSHSIQGWREDHRGGMGRVTLQYARPRFVHTPAHLRLEAFSAGAGVANLGPMEEMSVKGGEALDLSFHVRGNMDFDVALEDGGAGSNMLARATLSADASWRCFQTTFTPAVDCRRARLRFAARSPGVLELEQVSLMPHDRFRNRVNGLRKDIATLFADLKPATFRFPGGCMLEGNSFASWYDWKLSVGPVPERRPIWNVWGYYQTLGLGYFEYLQFSEDIGASPIPVFSAGLSCQYRPPYQKTAGDGALAYFATNILDGIEFARGPATSTWGRIRAAMGHPKPFRLEMIGIGNENFGEDFFDRYDELQRIVKGVHPDIRIVSDLDPGGLFSPKKLEYSWSRISRDNADFADDHIYASPSWWLNNTHRFDSYPRKGVPVYVGEWASRKASDRYINSMYCAVAEAAFRMGFERNADLVQMSAYAPLIRRVGFPGNRYSLIQLDGTSSCGAPSYYVEKMFSLNRPDRLLPTSYPEVRTVQPAGIDRPARGKTQSDAVEVVSFHAVAGVKGGSLVMKFANAAFKAQPVSLTFAKALPAGRVRRTLLTGAADATNTPQRPHNVIPKDDTPSFGGGSSYTFTLPPCSVCVLVFDGDVSPAGGRKGATQKISKEAKQQKKGKTK
ncbi:MAG: hypothetical protein IKO72_03450 [Kiritimatiellae bacterium]|nr:hypothetical protein [Kiritimatiellia bacterium]